jgi:hypothetical protein
MLDGPCADGDDDAGLLGERDELGRGHVAVDVMIPAKQSLCANCAAVGQPDDGLVDEVQLVAAEGGDEIALVFVAPFGLAAEVGIEVLDLPFAQLFGAVHRQVGVAHHVRRAVLQFGDGDPDTA